LINVFEESEITRLENFSDYTVIVEGKKDKNALIKFGIENIFDISGKSFDEILEKVEPPVIILTDFDKEGEKKNSILTKLFQSNGIKIDSSFRKKFKSVFKIQKIEELNSFIKLEDDIHGKVSSINDKVFNRGRVLDRWNCRKTRHNRSNLRPD